MLNLRPATAVFWKVDSHLLRRLCKALHFGICWLRGASCLRAEMWGHFPGNDLETSSSTSTQIPKRRAIDPQFAETSVQRTKKSIISKCRGRLLEAARITVFAWRVISSGRRVLSRLQRCVSANDPSRCSQQETSQGAKDTRARGKMVLSRTDLPLGEIRSLLVDGKEPVRGVLMQMPSNASLPVVRVTSFGGSTDDSHVSILRDR